MSSKNNSYKNVMYEQQVKHLPAQTIDNLVDLIENKLKPKMYGVVLHDKDIDEQGQPTEPHGEVIKTTALLISATEQQTLKTNINTSLKTLLLILITLYCFKKYQLR